METVTSGSPYRILGDLEVLGPIEVAAGAVLFFGPLLVHKSEPNRSPKERRALLFSYQPAGRRQLIDFVPPTR